MRRDIDDALKNWAYEPEPGENLVREVRARDGRSLIQVRVELGMLQIETEGRPDGLRPHGFTTYLDFLRHRAAGRGLASDGSSPPWSMGDDQCVEADREFVQFYHRRMAWLSLRRYDRALADADHTLALMDFVCRHGCSEGYVASHERFRGLVLFHRTRAAAAVALEKDRPEEAIDIVREGRRLMALQAECEEDDDHTTNAEFIEQLQLFEADIRKQFRVPKTLGEQLDEAVASEDYEKAARLLSQIRAQRRR